MDSAGTGGGSKERGVGRHQIKVLHQVESVPRTGYNAGDLVDWNQLFGRRGEGSASNGRQ